MESGEPGAGKGSPLEISAKALLLKISLKKTPNQKTAHTLKRRVWLLPTSRRGCILPPAARRGRSLRAGSARPAPGAGCFRRRLPGQASPLPPRQAAARAGGPGGQPLGLTAPDPRLSSAEARNSPRPFLSWKGNALSEGSLRALVAGSAPK